MKTIRSFLILCCLFLLTGCTKPEAQIETNWVLMQEDACILADGTAVDIWQLEPLFTDRQYYRLKDGTDLLVVEDTPSLRNVSAGYLTLTDLNEAAQTAICRYYEELGLLYDTSATLERAYGEYRACMESGEVFSGYHLAQHNVPYSFGERVVCILTSVEEPVSGIVATETRLYTYFDRETGESVSPWDLFTVPEQEVRQHLVSFFAADAQTSAHMLAALKPEYIGLYDDCVEIFFPAGSLPNEEYATGASIDYARLDGILHDWAVPQSP